MVAFMLILAGISGLYSSLFGRNSKKRIGEKLFFLIVATVFLAYGGYIVYLYYGGTFGRELLVGDRRKTAFLVVDTAGIFLFVVTIILGRLLFKNKRD